MLPFSRIGVLRDTRTSRRHCAHFAKPLGLALGATLLLAPSGAWAADLSFSPSTGSHAVGESFSVQVQISPGNDSVNAADGTVTYDKDLLSLDSFSKDGSVFSLWTSEPVISQADGTLDFSGGTPTAFSTDGTVLTLKFKALKTGTATVSISKGSILAADGKGTDVYASSTGATFTIVDAAPAPAAAAPTDPNAADASVVDTGPPPIAPIIDSATFPKEDGWYATSTGTFSWTLLPDITGVRTLLSTSDSATPTQIQSATSTTQLVTGIADGTSYFYVQFQNASGWGDVAKRKVQIDTTPPADFDIALVPAASSADVPKLSFKADDALSGIDHYQLLLGTTSVATIAAKDMPDGTYPVPPQNGGQQEVVVRAYDMAGNMREVTKELDLPKVAKPAPKDASGATAAPASSFVDRMLEILLALGLGALFAWIRFTKKKTEQDHLTLLKRMAEVSDKNDRVFSAMREEFEQMVNDFDKRPQLTPEERAFLEDIKEVLDISEELINAGMDDLKKLVRGN